MQKYQFYKKRIKKGSSLPLTLEKIINNSNQADGTAYLGDVRMMTAS